MEGRRIILDGLSQEYSAFITSIVSQSDPYSIPEIEALLMAQEERIEHFKQLELEFVQANLAQTSLQAPRSHGGRQGNGGRKCRGRGCGGRSWNNRSWPQYQLCNKVGHTVWQCYHWFDQGFPNPNRMAINPPHPPFASFHQYAPYQQLRAYLATPFTLSVAA